MPEKQKTSHNWKNPKTIIAAVSVTGLLTLWNSFASHDRQRTGEFDTFVPTPTVMPEVAQKDACPTPAPVEHLGTRCVPVTQTRSS